MRLAPALLLAALLPGAAGAVELVLGVTGQTDYNSNVFGQSENAEADGDVQGGPILKLRDRTGQLTWEINYEPSYQAFFRLSDINDFYHVANGRLSWRPSAKTEFYGTDIFSITPVRDTTFQTGQPTPAGPARRGRSRIRTCSRTSPKSVPDIACPRAGWARSRSRTP